YVSYEFVRNLDSVPAHADSPFPEFEFGLYLDGVIVDHVHKRSEYFAHGRSRFEDLPKATRSTSGLRADSPKPQTSQERFMDAVVGHNPPGDGAFPGRATSGREGASGALYAPRLGPQRPREGVSFWDRQGAAAHDGGAVQPRPAPRLPGGRRARARERRTRRVCGGVPGRDRERRAEASGDGDPP